MTEDTIKITAVGDIFLGEHPVTLGHGVNSIVKQRGCDFLFSKIPDTLNGGDIVCGNLEGIISPKKESETGIKSAIFWGEPECARGLRLSGFNCLFLANNHTAQHGEDALKRTCVLLDKNNIKWTGFNSEDTNSSNPIVFQIRGLRVALLAYCETQQYNLDTPILPLINFTTIQEGVDKLRKNCDIIIVSLHWGDEFIDYPSPKQIDLAHRIIDLGVHLILGHHSHTLQGIERYKSGIIAYSLGSFTKDLWPLKLRESVVLKCEISAGGVRNYNFVPIKINRNYQPEIYRGDSGKNFVERIKLLSREVEDLNLTDAELMRNMQLKYSRDAKRLLIRDRFETLIHYILNFPRYDKQLLMENIKLMIKRRIRGKNL